MPYKYSLSQAAEDDILEAHVWYEQQRKGLGEEFLEALDIARQAVLRNPVTYRIRFKKKVRSFLVDRFPYLLLYILENKDVNVIAVFHTSRDPKIWKERVEK